jgi:pyrrolidone-carboxylate peptidase
MYGHFRITVTVAACLFALCMPAGAGAYNIMLTGYWPPTGGTNGMLTGFSTNTTLNPGGWAGGNWNNLGFDVYSFFPTFPGGTGSNPKGTGDFEVDYQDTWNDFWRITDELDPVAIISYGLGSGPWEIEYNARNLSSSNWYNDYLSPYRPERPDGTVPAGYFRHSTLPVDDIASAVNAAGLAGIGSTGAWVDYSGNPGAFLCEYMAYLGMWYQDMHSSKTDPFRCYAAGFIHVGSGVSVNAARMASEITLLETIGYLNDSMPVPTPLPPALALFASGIGAMVLGRKISVRHERV